VNKGYQAPFFQQ